MSQKIFSMNLDIETVSLYLLCCAVADTGIAITERILLEKWNGSPDDFKKQLDLLRRRNILSRQDEIKKGENGYILMDEKYWS